MRDIMLGAHRSDCGGCASYRFALASQGLDCLLRVQSGGLYMCRHVVDGLVSLRRQSGFKNLTIFSQADMIRASS